MFLRSCLGWLIEGSSPPSPRASTAADPTFPGKAAGLPKAALLSCPPCCCWEVGTGGLRVGVLPPPSALLGWPRLSQENGVPGRRRGGRISHPAIPPSSPPCAEGARRALIWARLPRELRGAVPRHTGRAGELPRGLSRPANARECAGFSSSQCVPRESLKGFLLKHGSFLLLRKITFIYLLKKP